MLEVATIGRKKMARGEYKKARIMFTCEHEIKEKLQSWANSENRTLSNLMELLAEQAIATKETKEKEATP